MSGNLFQRIGGGLAIWLACVLAGCAPEDGPVSDAGAEAQVVEDAVAAEPGAPPTTAAPSDPPADAAPAPIPAEIYYDLTGFDWYRRGEPLVVDGQPFLPAGPPQRIPAEDLAAEGTHQGVTYYARSGSHEPDPAVYVPVFEGYWLPFHPRGSAHAE